MPESYTRPRYRALVVMPHLAQSRTLVRMDREDRLFDDCARTDMKPKSHGEPTFSFRNRSGWEASHDVRNLLESIYARYPSDERRHVRSRFRSDRDSHHEGALFELLLFATMLCNAVKVNADTPDFEFTSREGTFLLEAKVFDEYGTSDHLEERVLEAIERKLNSSDYFLSISPHGALSSTPPDDCFVEPIRELLDTPRAAWDEATARKEVNLDAYSEGSYRLLVQLWPKASDSSEHRLIGAQSSDWGWVGAEELEWGERLLRGLERKAKKLKGRPKPAYLAVSVPSELLPSPGPIAIRALYGASSETRESGLDCFWQKRGEPRSSHVKGVLVCGKLLPHALDHPEMACSLYLASGADEPPEPLSRLPRVWLEGRELRSQPGETLGALVRDGLGVAL